eukprot:765641-Pleurochrysis_carterae.AAC.2
MKSTQLYKLRRHYKVFSMTMHSVRAASYCLQMQAAAASTLAAHTFIISDAYMINYVLMVMLIAPAIRVAYHTLTAALLMTNFSIHAYQEPPAKY